MKNFIFSIDKNIYFLLLLPVLLLTINDNWIFNPTGFIDPWIYTGYFINLPIYLKTFIGTYYSSRLGWIVPGFLTYHIFGPLLGNYILHLIVYNSTVLSLYVIIKFIFNKTTAFLTAILLGSYGWFLWAAGWDYMDGPSIAYCLLTLVFITKYLKKQRLKRYLFFAGMAYAGMVHTNLFSLFFLPFILIYFFILVKQELGKSIINLQYFFYGISLLTAVLGLFNYFFTKNFYFWTPSMKITSTLLNQPNPWKNTSYGWINDATWLYWPFSVFILSIINILYLYTKKVAFKYGQLLVIQIIYVIIFFVYIILNLTPYAPVLQIKYYASFLIPWMFLALGGYLYILLRKSNFHLYLFEILLFINIYKLLSTKIFNIYINFIRYGITWTIFLILIAIIVFIALENKRTGFVICLYLLAASNIVSGEYIVYPKKPRIDFLSIVNAQNIINSKNPLGDSYFWYENDPELNKFYTSLSSTFLWGYRLIGDDLPGIKNSIPLSNKQKIVIFNKSPKVLDKIRDPLLQRGFSYRVYGNELMQRGNTSFFVTFIELKRNEDSI